MKSCPQIIPLVIFFLGMVGCRGMAGDDFTAHNHSDSKGHDKVGSLAVPASIAAEHHELHEMLRNAINSGGTTAEAAKTVEQLLSTHFEKEERYALPQLGLLRQLAAGEDTADKQRVIELSDTLKADLPNMLEEHKKIVQALNALAQAAKAENKADAARFAETLKAHAQNEEEVMYPAAILVGEYLKLKQGL